MAEEWDVFSLLPGGDYGAPEYLATLYEAREKTIRVELNGCGAGSFAINRTSPECTEAILAQGNLVRVRIPEIHDDYIFAFFLETGDFTLISSQEGGGEMLTFGGRGILSYLEYARAWSESFIDGGMDPIAGLWNAYAAGTGAAPGQILRRLIEEFQDPERPQQPIPLLGITFDYDDDSTADPWDETDATDEFKYQVGEDGLAIVTRLWETDYITVQMDADFTLHAYNVDNYGRDLSGDAFGTDIVRFERGVNIATEFRRELAVSEVATHILVGGEADKYATTALSDAATRVTKEAFIAAFGVTTTALVGIGQAELNDRLGKSDTITFPIANRRTEVDLADPVTVGSVMSQPGLATAGYYLPGPEGTNGDFWVGDTVRVHTGSGPFDYDEVDWRVHAIMITRDDDNHELIVIPELAERQPVLVDASGILYYAKTGGSDGIGPAIQFVFEHDGSGGGGCTPVARVGPIVEGPIIVNLSDDTPATGIDGWIINAQGTIDIRMRGDVGGVAGTAIHTITLLMNGVSVFTEVFDDVTNPSRAFDFTATLTCPLSTGNALTATYQHNQPGGFAGVPAGAGGCGEVLEITGAELVLP